MVHLDLYDGVYFQNYQKQSIDRKEKREKRKEKKSH